MSNYENPRTDHDLSHFVFDCGRIGRVKVISHSLVLPGDTIDIDAVGAFRLSPLKRGMSLDTKLDIVSFYVPMRHVYDNWIGFSKLGVNTSLTGNTPNTLTGYTDPCKSDVWGLNYLGLNNKLIRTGTIPKWLSQAYLNIYNNYYKVPTDADELRKPNAFSQPDCEYGLQACHLENFWTAPLPNATQLNKKMNLSDSNQKLDIMALQKEFATLETEQERHFFMTRYRDIIKDMGGYVDTDADKRPTMLMRTEFWASGYDVDGTGQSTMGQFSGRVQQSWRHSVPKFFVPEHGVILTLALARFPAIYQDEVPYMVTAAVPSYAEIFGDPAIVANMPPVEITGRRIGINNDGNSKFKVPYAQWYRYQPSYVNEQYAYIKGFPFLNKTISVNFSNNKTKQCYVDSDDYDDMFETMNLDHWNIQCKFNVHVDRNLPTARESIMTSN